MFTKLKIFVAISLLSFVLIVGNIFTAGFIQNKHEEDYSKKSLNNWFGFGTLWSDDEDDDVQKIIITPIPDNDSSKTNSDVSPAPKINPPPIQKRHRRTRAS